MTHCPMPAIARERDAPGHIGRGGAPPPPREGEGGRARGGGGTHPQTGNAKESRTCLKR